MVFGVIVLFVVFVVTRVLLVRGQTRSSTANVVAAAVVIAFLAGSLSRPFGLPRSGSEYLSPTGTTASVTPVEALDAHDVSSNCEAIHSSAKPNFAIGSFDSLVVVPGASAVPPQATIARDAAYEAVGWAADDSSREPALAACAMIDGAVVPGAEAAYGLPRVDVARAMKDQALTQTGFKIAFHADTLPRGAHTLAIWVWSHDGTYAPLRISYALNVR